MECGRKRKGNFWPENVCHPDIRIISAWHTTAARKHS